MSKENLRGTPLIPPPVLARALGVPVGTVEKAMAALGIAAFQSTATARKLITPEEAERCARRIRPASAAT